MKCPMAPTTLSWWRLSLYLTSVLSCVQAAIQDNQRDYSHDYHQSPSLQLTSRPHDAQTLKSSIPWSYDARKDTPTQRRVRYRRSVNDASVPQFMKDFYEHYAENSILQPSYDVIRSFYPQRTEIFEDSFNRSSNWVLTFRLTSLKMERVKLAELRIFFISKDPWKKNEALIVNLLEMKRDKKTGRIRRKRLVSTVKMEGATEKAGIFQGQWLTLNVTKLARRAFRRRSHDLELAIVISPVTSSATSPAPSQYLAENSNGADDTSPVLVVYSDEVVTSFKLGNDYATSWHNWRRRSRNQTASELLNNISHNLSIPPLNFDAANLNNSTSKGATKSRAPRSTQRRRTQQRRRRRGCRRKAMYVKFEDINWHNQIIAPRGYQAYRCVGKCFFPLSDRLSPTKHAIIQTLLYTNRPESVARPCCVPTALDPIPILYIDENDVVTYKYRFEGMVAKQCGCR